jgi:hypothetical protein
LCYIFGANGRIPAAIPSSSNIRRFGGPVSPILVRPVREQLEHDRVIRLLQAKYKRKYEVAINPGQQQVAPVGTGPSAWYPDLVLHSTERGRRLAGVVEVETAESVNNLEAMSQWVAFSKQRADFHLYVPASAIDVTRRLCTEIGIEVTEIWAYHSVGDQLRFVLVQRAPGAPVEKPAPKAPKASPVAKPAPKVARDGKDVKPAKEPKVAAAKPAAAVSRTPVKVQKAAPKVAAKPVAKAKSPAPAKPKKPAGRALARPAVKAAKRR